MASRTEQLLEALLNGGTVDFEPRSRNEALLYALLQKGTGGGYDLLIQTVELFERDGEDLNSVGVEGNLLFGDFNNAKQKLNNMPVVARFVSEGKETTDPDGYVFKQVWDGYCGLFLLSGEEWAIDVPNSSFYGYINENNEIIF